MNLEFKESVWKGLFKPTQEAADLEDQLRAKFGLAHRYDAARLMIGRSLADPTPPPALPADAQFGKPLPGEHLFGDDLDLWLCALILDARLGEGAAPEHVRPHIEAHWARGAKLIKQDWEEAGGDEARLITRLAEFLPEAGAENQARGPAQGVHPGEIRVKIGPVSRTLEGDHPVDFSLNGPGNSPHLALMGRTRSGKTTTGIQMAHSIVAQSNIPMVFIDPQGGFITDGKLNDRFPSWPVDIEPIEVGEQPIPLDFLPQASVGHVAIQNAAMTLRDSVCLCCKSPGNLMQARLLQSIEQVITSGDDRSLESIKQTYEQRRERDGADMDSIEAQLDGLTRLRCFAPTMSAADFFSRSWVISLQKVKSEELKRLVMLLLLDATAMHFLAQPEAPLRGGFRQMRQLMVIDEARKILQEKKSESLIQMVTRSAAKGLSVMLLSQDPSDFEGQSYDFTTQLGAVISFYCNQTHRGLRSLQGVFGRKLQAEEFSDAYLETGVAFAKLPGRQAMRIKAWAPVSSA
jgi:hypothetical protein